MPFSLVDLYTRGGTIVVPTNGVTASNGDAVMGAGVALAAKQLQPALPTALGAALRTSGNQLYLWPSLRMVTFPTKHDWREPATMALVERSAIALAALLQAHPDLLHVYMPRPGCGHGGLLWVAVEPVLDRVFSGDLHVRVLMACPG